MMTLGILLLALLAPLIYALNSHVDNILLSKYFKEGGVGTLLIFSTIASILVTPIFYFIDPSVLSTDYWSILILVLVGFLNVLLMWCYLQAIFGDEPTVVMIYYQLVPLLGLVFGYFILNETIADLHLIAMCLIILGAIAITYTPDEDGKVRFRLRTAVYMLIASTCWAAETTIFKMVALEENVWRSLFWEHLTLIIIGSLLFLVPMYRKHFMTALQTNSRGILGLNFGNEALSLSANVAAAYVVILIPVSLTLLMNSLQPLFVLALGYLLKYMLPRLQVEHVNNRNLTQKIVALILTIAGVYLLGR